MPYWLVFHPHFSSLFLVCGYSSNVLLNSEWQLHLADFGPTCSLSSLLSDDGSIAVLTGYVATRRYRAPYILLGSAGYTCLMDLWPSAEFTVCWARAAKCWWPTHHSSFGYSSLPAPFFLAQQSILFASLSAILQVLPCLVHSCKEMTLFARSTARFSTVWLQACIL